MHGSSREEETASIAVRTSSRNRNQDTRGCRMHESDETLSFGRKWFALVLRVLVYRNHSQTSNAKRNLRFCIVSAHIHDNFTKI
jgi:hypothetical protein